MREQPVNEQCVDGNDDCRNSGIQGHSKIDGDPLLRRKGILNSVISQGEVLMKWFDGV